MKRAVLLLAATLQFASAFGQVAVRGVVKDPTGSLLYGAKITARPIEGNSNREVKQTWQSKNARYGTFSFTLPTGQYELCVEARGFQADCRNVFSQDQSSIDLSITLQVNSVDKPAPSFVMDNRLRELASVDAVDCDRVRIRKDPAKATECVLQHFQGHQRFFVRYDIPGIDSEVAIGLASNSQHVYTVLFDSFGISPEGWPKGSKLEDGNHNLILPCPVPLKLRVSPNGRALCLYGKDAELLLGDDF